MNIKESYTISLKNATYYSLNCNFANSWKCIDLYSHNEQPPENSPILKFSLGLFLIYNNSLKLKFTFF